MIFDSGSKVTLGVGLRWSHAVRGSPADSVAFRWASGASVQPVDGSSPHLGLAACRALKAMPYLAAIKAPVSPAATVRVSVGDSGKALETENKAKIAKSWRSQWKDISMLDR